MTGPARAADLIDNLRAIGVILTYDPDQRTLRCQDHISSVKVFKLSALLAVDAD